MPTFNLKDSNNVEIKVTTYYEKILNEFNEKLEIEEKKYPLSDREKLFANTIRELLQTLDSSYRRW